MTGEINSLKIDLTVWKHPTEGYLQNTYSPLRTLLDEENKIVDFNIDAKKLNLSQVNNLVFECQPSYDGTVNLIFNDDINPPRIINSRFTKKENNTFKVINRIQSKQSNLYNTDKLDSQTRLVKNLNKFPTIDLLGISSGGQLKGGNYTIYIKYIDSDYNESPIICESGQISIFHGNHPSECSAALGDELTQKAIRLWIKNLDTSYNSVKLYLVRNYSDTNGTKLTEAFTITEPYVFSSEELMLTINGFENTESINIDELNTTYQSINSVKTQAQVQNMLFFGNVEKTVVDESDLQNCSYYIHVKLKQEDSIGYVSTSYNKKTNGEYYDEDNIYYKLGYWPGEYYKLGIVYILNDDTITPAFNLRGCLFNELGQNNIGDDIYNDKKSKLSTNSFLTKDVRLFNTFGVFKNPSIDIMKGEKIQPLYYEVTVPKEVKQKLNELGVKGYFIVRQKRIPTILGQGISFGVDRTSYSPMIPQNNEYITEGFLKEYSYLKTHDFGVIEAPASEKQSSCLISLEANVSPSLQSILDGSSFVFEKVSSGTIVNKKRSYVYVPNDSTELQTTTLPAVYVSEGTPYKFIKEYGFSTKFGSAEDVKQISFFGKPILNSSSDEGNKTELQGIYDSTAVYGGKNINILRGTYTGIIGVCGNLTDACCYNIRIPGYNESKIEDYFNIRKNDVSEFYAISNRYLISDLDEDNAFNVFRGDCYTNTVTVRLNKNFVDPEVPLQDTIVDEKTWTKHYLGFKRMGSESDKATYEPDKFVSGDWSQINRADVNAVPLGMWFTYKCLSSNNLGLRAIDRSNVDEEALMGSPRSFYPVNGMNTHSSGKVSDSSIINSGYGSTVGSKIYLPYKELPYKKELFDNRIMFSNIQVEDEFQNGYRVFQNLAYKDLDRQYGAIVKLLPWGTDLFCVFEHGIGIVPVNQKALMSTTTGQSIHLYGSGVLQSQISLISGDYGSVWQESIIRTPIGVYGVDTFAKKIWRYSAKKGLETISDMAVQRFLNDNIIIDENSSIPAIGIKNVKTHYNNYKGDVIFTFYNYSKNVEWSLCYNERLGKWITKYSWTPLYSENINNIYYSFDKRRAEVLAQIGQTNNDIYGIKLENSKEGSPYLYSRGVLDNKVYLTSTPILNPLFTISLLKGRTSYLDEHGKEIVINLDKDVLSKFVFVHNEPLLTGSLKIDADGLRIWWNSLFVSKETDAVRAYLYNQDDERIPSNISASEALLMANVDSDEDINISEEDLFVHEGHWAFYITMDSNKQLPVPLDIPLWLRIDIDVDVYYSLDGDLIKSNAIREYTMCFMVKPESLTSKDKEMYDEMFINGVYVHGRAGIFDEIDYTDDLLDNQILPTKWYGKQEPFEFEFVINDPIGLHKIFENLTIISNNVAPESIQFEIEGDAYSVWKTMGSKDMNPTYDKNLKKQQYKNNTLFKNASVKWDTILNQYSILMTQECKSIEKFGRRLGNMHYKEDSWYVTINPLLLNKNEKITSTKLRDKYLKVRVRYSGEDLAVITAIKSMVNLSAS